MQQTILALGALMIILMTAISHQRSAFMIQELSYVRELENAALDLAKLRTETILNQTQFDEAWLDQFNLPSGPSILTPTSSFGVDSGDPTDINQYDDVDDFHNVSQLNFPHSVAGDTFLFNITYSVSYIDGVGDTTSTRTFDKKLTTSVVSVDTIGTRVARATHWKTTILSDDLL